MDFRNVFYVLASVVLLLVIINVISIMVSKEEKEKVRETVVIPGYNYFVRPFWRRRFLNRPWVGWRPGGGFVGPFGRRYRLRRR